MQPQVAPGAIHIQPLRGCAFLSVVFMIDSVLPEIGKRYNTTKICRDQIDVKHN